jgi:membrane protease YdiL (CAAX protease family)
MTRSLDAPAASAAPVAPAAPRPSGRVRLTALFLAIALGGSYAIGALWIAHPQWHWLSQYLMWTPGIAGLVAQALRREPPRTMGFRFTGAAPWLVAFVYPFGVIAVCIALGYTLRAVTGSDIIHFQPATVHMKLFGISAGGMKLMLLLLGGSLALMVPWLVLALAYRYQLPERLGAGRHLARAALWAAVFWCYPNPWWLPPGCIGEELGWRGWLVRTWRDRPLVALGLSASAWAAFHLPLVVLQPPLHSFVPAASFLLAIAAAAAVFQALYLWSGSIWPPVIAHFSWNCWNPVLLGNQYGSSPSVFGGKLWLINGEGLLGMLVNGALTVALVYYWRRRSTTRS